MGGWNHSTQGSGLPHPAGIYYKILVLSSESPNYVY